MAAEAPPSNSRQGNPLTRKAGPLPAWAWAALLLVGYYLYTHFKGSSSSSGGSSTSPTDTTTGADMNPVPVGTDQTDTGLGGGGYGGQGPTTINNYYGTNPIATGGTGQSVTPDSTVAAATAAADPGTQATGGQVTPGDSFVTDPNSGGTVTGTPNYPETPTAPIPLNSGTQTAVEVSNTNPVSTNPVQSPSSSPVTETGPTVTGTPTTTVLPFGTTAYTARTPGAPLGVS